MDASEVRTRLEQHHRQSYGWALSCCKYERQQAEEVLQTVYLKILEGKARYKGASAFKTWLFSVIRKTAADEQRKSFVRRLRFNAFEEDLHESSDFPADELVSRSQLQQQLMRALSSLPTRQREVLHLVFYEDLTIADAANVLGVSIGSARTHYERGKQRLRTLTEGFHAIDTSQPARRADQRIVPAPEAEG